jgi:hypothetical protein
LTVTDTYYDETETNAVWVLDLRELRKHLGPKRLDQLDGVAASLQQRIQHRHLAHAPEHPSGTGSAQPDMQHQADGEHGTDVVRRLVLCRPRWLS